MIHPEAAAGHAMVSVIARVPVIITRMRHYELTSQLRIWIADSDHKSRGSLTAAAARMLIVDPAAGVTGY
jgi:hypothetical protein